MTYKTFASSKDSKSYLSISYGIAKAKRNQPLDIFDILSAFQYLFKLKKNHFSFPKLM